MKKYCLLLFLISVSGVLNFVFSIDTSAVKYYPLAIGNKWTYSHFATYGPEYRYQEGITGTLIMNGHLYYEFTYYRAGYGSTVSYRRIDSVKNNVLIYSSGSGCAWLQNETTGDSLSAQKGDSSLYGCSAFYRADTSARTLFGITRKTKIYGWSDFFEAGITREFTKDIGFSNQFSFGHTSTSSNSLIGCVINGILFGDTSLVGINQISSEVPEKYSLSQNYPNPFNPVTIIRFAIPSNVKSEMSNVKIIIYDVLGREVQTLINENLSPGIYEVDFDGSNFSSGVYYYTLSTNDFIETKRMVLIK